MRPAARGTIGVFAPASPYDSARFERGVEILRGLGHPVRVHPLAERRAGFLAGSDDERARAIHELAADPDIAILMAARGGYGVHRLLDRLDFDRLVASKKPIVGFSDLSALHLQIQTRGAISVHGPVVTQLGDLSTFDHQRLVDVLAGRWAGLEYKANGPKITGGVARGRLVGGCLSVIVPLLGTPYMPDLSGTLLLLEDVGEATYRIDRMLTHLLLSGELQKVAGVAFGELVRCEPQRPGEQTGAEVLAERLGGLGVPVLTGLPFGHGSVNQALPVGAEAELDADAGVLRVRSEV